MQANRLKHVRTFLIGYRSGGTPGFPHILRARDGIAGRRRGSSACQRPSNLPALRVARRCSPVGFDRQQEHDGGWDGAVALRRAQGQDEHDIVGDHGADEAREVSEMHALGQPRRLVDDHAIQLSIPQLPSICMYLQRLLFYVSHQIVIKLLTTIYS